MDDWIKLNGSSFFGFGISTVTSVLQGRHIKSSMTQQFFFIRGSGNLVSDLVIDGEILLFTLSTYKYFELRVCQMLLVVVVGAE